MTGSGILVVPCYPNQAADASDVPASDRRLAGFFIWAQQDDRTTRTKRGLRHNRDGESLMAHQESRTALAHALPWARSSIALHGRFSRRNRSVKWSGMLSYGNHRSKPESKCSGEQNSPRIRNRRQLSRANLPDGSCIGILQKEERHCKQQTASTIDLIVIHTPIKKRFPANAP